MINFLRALLSTSLPLWKNNIAAITYLVYSALDIPVLSNSRGLWTPLQIVIY